MEPLIPNIFHLVFGLKPQREPFHLLHYLCLKSCLEVNRPGKVYFYYRHEPHGRYWDLIRSDLTLVRVGEVPLVSATRYRDQAVRHYRYAHHADFIRVEKLLERGGVYADMDTIFVNPIPERLFAQPFVLGREQDFRCEKTGLMLPSLCNALIMSRPGAEFGWRWLRGMEETFDGTWSRHSGLLPWRLSQEHPELIHIEPVRSFFPYVCTPGAIQTLFEGCDSISADTFSIHLWHHMWASWWRRDCTTFHEAQLTEAFVRSVDTTYNLVARRFLPAGAGGTEEGKPPPPLRRISHADRVITRLGLLFTAQRGAIEQCGARLFGRWKGWRRISPAETSASPSDGPTFEARKLQPEATTADADVLISVVIPTIDRGAAIVQTVESVLANDYPNREIIVVDQSEDDRTELCLRPYVEAGRLRYLRGPRQGVALGRNQGARAARGALIAYTDDDCTVPPAWLTEVARVFQSDQRISMMFGNVLAGAHSKELGFVQAYVRTEPFLATNATDKHCVEGIGACMALRRSIWDQVGGFDLALGAGSTFHSAEETDLAFRVLLAGHAVYETPAVSVVHHGFRSWADRPRIIRDYLYGLGAMSAKHLLCGNWKIVKLMFHLACRWAFAGPVADLGGRPPRIMRLNAYLRGLVAGAASSPDRRTCLYRPDRGQSR